jgi:aspartyl-tRNA(Asn)/glutamyl-tRNA(Gln) amidotransferase subunit B
MISAGRITGKSAKQTLELVIAEDRDPEDIVREKNWEQLTDPEKIAETARKVVAEESATVNELRNTANEKRRKTLNAYLVGKVLSATGGRADPKIAGEQLEKLLSPPSPPKNSP